MTGQDPSLKLGDHQFGASGEIRRAVLRTLFQQMESMGEGAIAVDAQARVAWINEKYARKLGLATTAEAIGREIEQIIPNSLMRQVVQTGEPVLLDIMEFGAEQLVVTRMPLTDTAGAVVGAVGFVVYDRVHYLKPLVAKFEHLHQELESARRHVAEGRHARYTFASVVGASPACVELKRQARRAAQLDATVLLLGETGTGKELLAHAIHAASPRNLKPFVALNIAAVPESLLEAEFFGAAPGAYTGADRRGRDGKFKLADGGTLFLDEVGDMPLNVQAKLLRVLQEQEIEPLGSNRLLRVDVRVIAATSVDLEAQVRQGRFRADLYYRLNVLSIALPPLRDRLQDLAALVELFLAQISERSGLPQREITEQGLAALAGHGWPGNIRELRNVLEKAVMLSEERRLDAADFRPLLPTAATAAPAAGHLLADAVVEAERDAIQAALAAAGGNRSKAAQLLGISRATLYEKLARSPGGQTG
ncbi:sigma 54-interacting transcriptional regulator [Paucibacter sp. R3-3]|uniref:Sigma 54-interacting transcriptional regulator n=1 Tax=Roseateles agri TaxID=3098619 RepID=A0ABU5DFF9_9BURK|nr:sigma 54-interacting transcriptional regulator [Paucibacter sp. R3-3]MDY0744864.1 sigma 54-interacting transcriptional regulator [Paucibacter sp. R3-3]